MSKPHRIKNARNPPRRSEAKYDVQLSEYNMRRHARNNGRSHFDSMGSHAGRQFCKQLLGSADKDGHFIVPSDLTATREQVLADMTGGTIMEFRRLGSMYASTGNNAAFMTIACNSTGYQDSTDFCYTSAAYAGMSAPTANPTTGAVFGSSCPLSLVTLPTSRGERNCHVFSQTVRLVQNSASAMNRSGQIYAGWVKDPALITVANLAEMPGIQMYDLAQIEDEHYPIIARPPWSLTVNDDISGESVNYGATKGGVLFFAAYNLPTGSSLAFEISTSVFYYGEKIASQDFPTFSTMAADCALTCWLKVFGRSATMSVAQRPKNVKRVDQLTGVHTLAHTAQPLVKTAWEKAKEYGLSGLKWLGKEAIKFLPEALTALL